MLHQSTAIKKRNRDHKVVHMAHSKSS